MTPPWQMAAEPEFRERSEATFLDYCRGAFEGTLKQDFQKYAVVEPYSRRLRKGGVGSLTASDQEEIDRRRSAEGRPPLNWESVRRLDELAGIVNDSLRGVVYKGQPIEWRKLYDAAVEAGRLIYGSGGTFLDKVVADSDDCPPSEPL